MLRIHDLLGWIRIRIRGSMPLTNGSGSGSFYFRHWPSRCQPKTKFLTQFYYFLKLHLIHFSKIKSQKESQNSRNQGFSYYFCMMIEGSGSRAGSGSGSIPLTSGSGGSGRPKNTLIRWIRIRIRIRNTARKERNRIPIIKINKINWFLDMTFSPHSRSSCNFFKHQCSPV